MADAFFHPNSRARLSIMAKQGMYIMVTKVRTISCTDDIMDAKSVVWKMTESISIVSSFLTIPNIRRIHIGAAILANQL